MSPMVKIPHGTIVDMILADPVIAKQFECYLSSHSLRHQKKLEAEGRLSPRDSIDLSLT